MNREPFWWPMMEPPMPVDRDHSANRVELSPSGQGFLRRINPREDLRMERPDLIWEDREPQPGDGPDYRAEHSYWEARQEPEDV